MAHSTKFLIGQEQDLILIGSYCAGISLASKITVQFPTFSEVVPITFEVNYVDSTAEAFQSLPVRHYLELVVARNIVSSSQTKLHNS